VRVRAEGLSMSMLPDAPWQGNAAMRVYSEPAAVQESTDGMYITGTRLQRHTFVPTKPGALRLPGLEVLWWNVTTGTLQRATLPARTVTITGTALPEAGDTTGAAAPDRARVPDSPLQELAARLRAWPAAPWLLVGVLVLSALLAMPLLLRHASAARAQWRTRRQAARDAPEARARVQARALHAACAAGDRRATRRAFTEWLALQPAAPAWADDAPVRELRRALGNPEVAWSGTAFWAWFAATTGQQALANPSAAIPPSHGRSAAELGLPALYPTSARDLDTTS
jgi:hypothetical protein